MPAILAVLGCGTAPPVVGPPAAAHVADSPEANVAALARHHDESDAPRPCYGAFAFGRFLGHAQRLQGAIWILDHLVPSRRHGLIVLPEGCADVDLDETGRLGPDKAPRPVPCEGFVTRVRCPLATPDVRTRREVEVAATQAMFRPSLLGPGLFPTESLDPYTLLAGAAQVHTATGSVRRCRRAIVRWILPELGVDRLDVALVPER